MSFSTTTYRNYLLFVVSLLISLVAFAKDDPDPSKAIPARLQKTYNGKVIIAADAFPTTIDADLEKLLKEKSKKDAYVIAQGGKKTWTISMIAFLNKDPGTSGLGLVFYDKDNKESQKKLEPAQSIELSSNKGQRLYILKETALTEDAGFVAGKTYLVKFTQLKGGKEVTLAEAQLKLEPAAESKE